MNKKDIMYVELILFLCLYNPQLLIGFTKGLVVLWDTATNAAEKVFNTSSVRTDLISSCVEKFFIDYHAGIR